jgi:hypothetical protein
MILSILEVFPSKSSLGSVSIDTTITSEIARPPVAGSRISPDRRMIEKLKTRAAIVNPVSRFYITQENSPLGEELAC